MTVFVVQARQSGRTTRALADLPDGGVYLVSNEKMARYCRSLLVAAGRRPDAVHFVMPSRLRKLWSLPASTPWAIDHWCWDYAGRETAEAYDELSALFPKFKVESNGA